MQVIARRRETEIRVAARSRELIPRDLVQKQAAFLVLSLNARLLAFPGEHARELLNISDEREMAMRLDTIVRSMIETLAEMPERVTDEHWMKKVSTSNPFESESAAKSAEACREGTAMNGPEDWLFGEEEILFR